METIVKTCPSCKEVFILKHNHKNLGGVFTRLNFISAVQDHYRECVKDRVNDFAKNHGIGRSNED